MANGVNAVFSAFENSYHQQINRHFFKQYVYALGVAIILVFILILTVVGFGYAQIYLIYPIIETFSTGDVIGELFWITRARYFFFVIMIYVSMATIYYFGTKDGKLSSFFSIGAFFTTFLILLSSYLFGLYIDNFSKYNELSTQIIIRFLGFIVAIVAKEPIDIKTSPSPETQSIVSLGLARARPKDVGRAPPIAPPNKNVFGLSFVKNPISFAGPANPEIIKNLSVSPNNIGIAFFLSNEFIFIFSYLKSLSSY